MLFGNFERRLFSLFRPVMLISRKMTQDKRVVKKFQKFEYEDCQKQFGISTSKEHIYNIG